MFWNFRCLNYSSASTAKWAYNAEALGPLDLAKKAAKPSGTTTFGTEVVKHEKLGTSWTPILSTNIGGSEFLTHTGLYNVWARVYSTSPGGEDPVGVWLRLVYGVGDIVGPQENTQVQIPGASAFYLVNLGQVNLTAVPFGSQRWEGAIEGYGEASGANVSIDRLWLVCADESSGALTASESAGAIPSILASDTLTGSGALKESAAARGGKWEPDSGATEDFTRTAEGVERKDEDKAARIAILSASTVGAVKVSLELKSTGLGVKEEVHHRWIEKEFGYGVPQGFYLRYYSSTYWVRIVRCKGANGWWYVEYSEGGEEAEKKVIPILNPLWTSGFVSATGEINENAEVTLTVAEASATPLTEPVTSSAIALPALFRKGGTYAEGKVGIYDVNPYVAAATRLYRNFVAVPVVPDAVMYADKSASLSTAGMWRESEDGKGYGPIGFPGADLPRLPVSGPEENPVEIAVKPSRGNLGDVADPGVDKVSVKVSYRPCYSTIPEE